jgi:hypothetical protein
VLDYVTMCQQSAVDGMEMFLRNFARVPDDHLDWSPAPTANSPLRIGAHTALYASRFAKMIREQALPRPENLAAWLAEREAEERQVTDGRQIEPIFRAGTEEVLAALASLSPEDVARTLDSGQGWSVPMTHLMRLPGWHATLHTGQIDYLQTCWGDMQVYVG